MNFTYVAAKNFLCFGNEGIEIDLKNLPAITVIEGRNYHDLHRITGKPGSNGAGKSAAISVITYALFGKTVRSSLTMKDYTNKKATDKCRCEVRWDKYRVVREQNQKSQKLFLYEEDEISGEWIDISKGTGTPAIQKDIEEKIGLDFQSFSKIVIFDDDNRRCFLECDSPTKRSIVENLLSLDLYREYHQNAKSILSDLNQRIKTFTFEYESSLSTLRNIESRLHSIKDQKRIWMQQKNNDKRSLTESRNSMILLLENTDQGKKIIEFEEAQKEITGIRLSSEMMIKYQKQIEQRIENSQNIVSDLQKDSNTHKNAKYDLESTLRDLREKIRKTERKIEELRQLKSGEKCDRCLSPIDPENAHLEIERCIKEINLKSHEVDELVSKIAEESLKITNADQKIIEEKSSIGDLKDLLSNLIARMNTDQKRLSELLKINRPDTDRQHGIIEQNIKDLNERILSIDLELERGSPFESLIMETEDEFKNQKQVIAEKRVQIQEFEKEIPYHQFWIKAFGDDGIRRYVIERIIPAMNAQIAYWLQILIDGNITVSFDDSLNSRIERVPYNGDPFLYSALSGGEHRRINLAIMLSFAYIMALSSGSIPNIIFLDEVAINVDENGVERIHDMIVELSKDRHVFITTHDPVLIDLLKDEKKLILERREGITRLVSC